MERVSNIVRERNRERKRDPILRHKYKVQFHPSILTHDQKTIQSESQTFIESGQMSIDQMQNIISSEIAELARSKIPYNQKVEQGIMHDISLCYGNQQYTRNRCANS